MASTRGPQPTSECWRRCDGKPMRFFLPNHDRVAESAVMKVVYGGIPQFLAAHGFGPDGRNPRRERDG